MDWNPCSSSRSPRDSTSSSYIVSVDNYVYVHCSSPDDGSYLMQCPSSTVWNPQTNGCSDFGGHGQSPPRLVGPLNRDGGGDSFTPSPPVPGTHRQPLHKYFAGLPHSLLSSVSGPPSTLLRPSASAGDLASHMKVNPCVLDDRGTLSPLRFHPYPDDPSKYLECVPQERSVITCCICHRSAIR